MGLLSSPIDGAPMRVMQRYGIEIEVCPTTGGVWRDRGELEKLVTLTREDAAKESPARAGFRPGTDDDLHNEKYARPGRT